MSNDIQNKEVLSISEETKNLLKETKEISAQVSVDSDLKLDSYKSIDNIPKRDNSKEISGVINIDDTLKDEPDKKIKITFKGKNFIKDEINKKTADAPTEDNVDKNLNQPKQLGEKEQTAEELRAEIKAAESETKESFTVDDYKMIAEFLIDILDWGGSSGLMYLAKDKTDAPYVLSVQKKERLKNQLTRILVKSSFKMNFGVLFAISLIIAYIKPLKAAIENRKVVKKGEIELKNRKDNELRKKMDEEENKRIRDLKKEEVVTKRKVVIQDIVSEDIINEVKKEEIEKVELVVKEELGENGKVLFNEEEETNTTDEEKETNAKGEEILTPDTIINRRGKVALRRRRGSSKG